MPRTNARVKKRTTSTSATADVTGASASAASGTTAVSIGTVSAATASPTGAVTTATAGTTTAAAAPAAGFDYYISTTGSNSNSGTIDSPWSITALHGSTKSAQLAGGKRIGLLDGTYNIPRGEVDSSWGGQAYNIGLGITQSGTALNPLVIESVNPRGAILAPGTNVNQSGGAYGLIIRNRGNYVQFKNLTFAAATVWGQIQIFGNDTVVEGCDFGYVNATWLGNDNCGHISFTLNEETTVKRTLISNNRFRGISNGADWNACAIMMFSHEDTIIEKNTFHDSNLYWTKYDWIGYTFRYNHVYDTGQGPYLSNSARNVSKRSYIHHNLIHSRWGGSGFESGETAPLLDFYNNTMVLPGNAEAFVWLRRLGGDANRAGNYYNNIFFLTSDMDSDMACAFCFPGATAVSQLITSMDYNCFSHRNSNQFRMYLGDPFSKGTTWTSLSSWRSATGFDANSIQANPTFVGATASNRDHWKLQAGSPCIGAGRTGGTSGGSAVNMGCWDGVVTQIGHNF